jgi:hypothetical protein
MSISLSAQVSVDYLLLIVESTKEIEFLLTHILPSGEILSVVSDCWTQMIDLPSKRIKDMRNNSKVEGTWKSTSVCSIIWIINGICIYRRTRKFLGLCISPMVCPPRA